MSTVFSRALLMSSIIYQHYCPLSSYYDTPSDAIMIVFCVIQNQHRSSKRFASRLSAANSAGFL